MTTLQFASLKPHARKCGLLITMARRIHNNGRREFATIIQPCFQTSTQLFIVCWCYRSVHQPLQGDIKHVYNTDDRKHNKSWIYKRRSAPPIFSISIALWRETITPMCDKHALLSTQHARKSAFNDLPYLANAFSRSINHVLLIMWLPAKLMGVAITNSLFMTCTANTTQTQQFWNTETMTIHDKLSDVNKWVWI